MKGLVCMVPLVIAACGNSGGPWTQERAAAWQKKHGWLIGANFVPSNAVNQLEMWQAETFDPKTIDRELGWAEALGMNVMRVFLHDLAWQADPTGFKSRMDAFLAIAARHRIGVIFTFFDDCWNADPKLGPQPAPSPGVHNSGWVRSPAKTVHDNPLEWGYLERYVKDVLVTFGSDQRVIMWDLYNEPGNSGYGESSFPLLQKIFEWAWSVRPLQPLTSGTWFHNEKLNAYQLSVSDVITFHNYKTRPEMELEIAEKQALGRPVICTEYMARTRGSRFDTHLPLLERHGVGAVSWGLVAGKSNTIYAWDTVVPGVIEPELWFHDLFRKDGTPYDEAEAELIATTAKKRTLTLP